MTTSQHPSRRTTRAALATLAAATLLTTLAACGGSSSTTPPTAGADSGASAVLPVQTNPIKNTSTAQALSIDSVLVENNVDDAGTSADDHLEIALTNTGSTKLSAFEVYYTLTDPKTSDSESYYTKLPSSFTIASGASRVIHFDNTGAADHFAVNQYSLYYTDKNSIDVVVEVSSVGSAPQMTTVTKDAGGAEEAD